MVFDPMRGRLYSKRSNRLLVSVKDPFMKEMNYGFQMREKEKLENLIAVLKSFLKAAADGSIDDFFIDRGDAALAPSATSISLTNSASPPGVIDNDEEEKKEPVIASPLNIT
jgi:hypothetical protein